MKKNHVKISDLIPDEKNFNKGSEFGNSLIEKSFLKFGAGRSILLDKNNRIIAGNKSVENAGAIGMEDVQIVESDGKRIIAVKRMDIDLNSPEGRELALADNATAKANIIFDAELIEAELGEAICEEWGASDMNNFSNGNREINFDVLGDEMILKLKYNEAAYNKVKEQLLKINPIPEQALWKLLGNE